MTELEKAARTICRIIGIDPDARDCALGQPNWEILLEKAIEPYAFAVNFATRSSPTAIGAHEAPAAASAMQNADREAFQIATDLRG